MNLFSRIKNATPVKCLNDMSTLYQFLNLAKIHWNYLTLISGRMAILRGLFGMPEGSSRNSVILR